MKSHLTLIALVAAVASVASLPPPNASAEELSLHGKRILRNAKFCFDELARDPAFFDGAKLGSKQRNQLERFQSRLVTNIKCVQSKMNRLPEIDRWHPDYKRYLARANGLVDYANRMKAALATQAKNAKAADAQCRAFQAATRQHGSKMRYWFQIHDTASGYFNDEKGAQQHLSAIDAVAKTCAEPQFANVGATGCEWLKLGNRNSDPKKWCAVAKKKKALGIQSLRSYAKFHSRDPGGRHNLSPEKVEAKEGWLSIEGPIELDKLTAEGKQRYKQIFDRVRPVAALMGDPDFFAKPEFEKPFVERMEKVQAAVVAAAPKWKRPKRRGSSYGSGLAKKTVRKWHKKAKVITSYQNSGTWKITANRITSVPEYRSVSGYVLFRLPGAKLCQLRSWTLVETYRGGGRFQRSLGVRMGYVRWQSCR